MQEISRIDCYQMGISRQHKSNCGRGSGLYDKEYDSDPLRKQPFLFSEFEFKLSRL